MKKNVLTLVLLILVNISFGQQNLWFPMNSNSNNNNQIQNDNCKPPERNYTEYQLSYPLEEENVNKDSLIKIIKYKAFKEVFRSIQNESNKLVFKVLEYHINDLVEITENEIFNDGSNKKPKWKLNITSVKIDINRINFYAQRIDDLLRLNTVVLYHPYKGQDDIELYEYARRKLNAKLSDFTYKIPSLKNLDVMPICEMPALDPTKENYYAALLECVKKQKVIDAQVAIVVRDIKIITIPYSENGEYKTELEMEVQVFNATTFSFIYNAFYKSWGSGTSQKASKENAIENILALNLYDIVFKFAGRYYDYAKEGREFNIILPYNSYNNDDNKLEEFKIALNTICGVEVDDDDDLPSIESYQIKCRTWIMKQSELTTQLRNAMKNNIIGSLSPKGQTFEIKLN